MSKKVKKNRHRKVDPYIPIGLLLLGVIVVLGYISWGGEKVKEDGRLSDILVWERKEKQEVEALPKEIKYEVDLQIPKNVKFVEETDNNQNGEVKIVWDCCGDAMAYDICINSQDGTEYEEVYNKEFTHKNPKKDRQYNYKVRARRYGLYTNWSPTISKKLPQNH